MGQLRHIESITKTGLWEQISTYCDEHESERSAVERLRANVRTVAERAAKVGSLVIRHMPEYTLHNERHFLNVLSVMDALVPDAVREQLHPVECALCILTAYTHDLGMALRAEELAHIRGEFDSPERRRWLRFLEGHGEEQRQITRWERIGKEDAAQAEEARRRIGQIEDFLLASFIRTEHTDAEVNRVQTWLSAIADDADNQALYTYEPPSGKRFDFKRHLALIGLSHGHDVDWLRRQFHHGQQDRFYRRIGHARINLAFPGLLLRLADIMDFDASRAPSLLFRHIGIENDVSLREWRKHLAVTGWDLDVETDRPTLSYEAESEHPVIEKTIREFGRMIERELQAVQGELDFQNRPIDGDDRYALRLPQRVEMNVYPAEDEHGRPRYHYADIEFRLDQDEVLQLLMGESLYGDPSLCIRELIQNALDALHLRDLRLQMEDAGEDPAEPVDRRRPDEELEVTVSWGHDEGSDQEFLRVLDNGVGMTKGAIERYFTQIGKSFYRSPDFARERAAMKRQGLFATPISQFGIGILSCFMLADRMEVRTRPGHAGADPRDENRKPYDVTISGPGSLFWLREGTLEHQGTEITLYLKDRFRLTHKPDTLLDRLREAFEYPTAYRSSVFGDEKVVDPAFVAGRYVVWPLYPVHLHTPSGPTLTIDDRLHPEVLAPIDAIKVRVKAAEWDIAIERVGTPRWRCWDWTDDEGDDTTGSRVRIWIPQNTEDALPFADPPAERDLIRQNDLAAFVEPQLENRLRTALLVQGMYVKDTDASNDALQLGAGEGTRVWLDLRGDLAPPLRASREATLPVEEFALWHNSVRRFLNQALEALLRGAALSRVRNARTGLRHTDVLGMQEFAIVGSSTVASLPSDPYAIDRLYQSLARDHTHHRDHVRDSYQGRDLVRHFDIKLEFARELHLDLDLDRDYDLALARHLIRDLVRDPSQGLSLALDRDLDHAPDNRIFLHRAHISGANLQKAYFPSLERSWPYLECFALCGQIGDARLTAPGMVCFETEPDGRTTCFADPRGKSPPLLADRGYDLCFPMAAVPLGALRHLFEPWRTDRRYYSLGVAPFIFPELANVWPQHTEFLSEIFPFGSLYALFPDQRLWYTPFEDWTEANWLTGYSALWEISTGRVLWAERAHTRDWMLKYGQPFSEVFPVA